LDQKLRHIVYTLYMILNQNTLQILHMTL